MFAEMRRGFLLPGQQQTAAKNHPHKDAAQMSPPASTPQQGDPKRETVTTAHDHHGDHKPVKVRVPVACLPPPGPGRAENEMTEDGRLHAHVARLPREQPTACIESTVACLLKGTHAHLAASEQRPAPLAVVHPRPYVVLDVPCKGVGVYARTAIAAGERIVVERPLVMVPDVFVYEDCAYGTWNSSPGEVLYGELLKAMCPANREAFLSLPNRYRGSIQCEVTGIIKSNAWKIGTLPGSDAGYTAVLRDGRWINHSCAPNAVPHWRPHDLTMTYSALRHIELGEEITVSHSADLLLPWAERQAALGFTCSCRTCTSSQAERDHDDQLRAFLKDNADRGMENNEDFVRWLQDGAPDPDVRQDGDGDVRSTKNNPVIHNTSAWNVTHATGVYDCRVWEPTLLRLVKMYSVLECETHVRVLAMCGFELARTHGVQDNAAEEWLALAQDPRASEWWARLGDARVDRVHSLEAASTRKVMCECCAGKAENQHYLNAQHAEDTTVRVKIDRVMLAGRKMFISKRGDMVGVEL
ncbi:hypothetical protein C8Q78DRAFT_1081516 [Trametes maxima]|nr:hypothetical protein C8Q78DRAFT_1081516 [Trametes maxima]